jgi:hypothetical protein
VCGFCFEYGNGYCLPLSWEIYIIIYILDPQKFVSSHVAIYPALRKRFTFTHYFSLITLDNLTVVQCASSYPDNKKCTKNTQMIIDTFVPKLLPALTPLPPS